MNMSRPTGVPPPTAELTHQLVRLADNRLVVSYTESPLSLIIDLRCADQEMGESLAEISGQDHFLLDELGLRVLDTETPMTWNELLVAPGAPAETRFAASRSVPGPLATLSPDPAPWGQLKAEVQLVSAGQSAC